MKITINGYEIEAPDDCSVTVDGSRIKIERKAEMIRYEPIYVPAAPTKTEWPDLQRPWWQSPVTYMASDRTDENVLWM
jgi:hypothetical protein